MAENEARPRRRWARWIDEDTVDPEVWGRNFPRQYDSYRRTALDMPRTRYGGGEPFSKLDADPRLLRIFDGYAFRLEHREEHGHAHMLTDQDQSRRIKE